MKILLVGGNWELNTEGKPSGVIQKIAEVLKYRQVYDVTLYNGGKYEDLKDILDSTPKYDIVFWFANVSNDLPKIRDVKEVAPFTMLVTSKRNDNNKYTDKGLVGRALASKSNLLFEFSKRGEIFNNIPMFHIRVIDPLACVWYDGNDITEAIGSAMHRLEYLKGVTRQRTTQFDVQKGDIKIPDQTPFIDVIHRYAERLQKVMPMPSDAVRFLGNASMKVTPVWRCSKSMPSFKSDGMVFVSRRNVPKQFIEMDDFIPVWLENGKIFYAGQDKPSVDTPVQIRLYDALPNIKYMIHTHAYIPGAPTTNYAIPCGAVEEVEEVLNLINLVYKSRNLTRYSLNLLGHGSIIMADTVEGLEGYQFDARPELEKMY